MSQGDSPIRRWRVRVVAEGYAVVAGATNKEAVEHASKGAFERTPSPHWSAQISDIKELDR